MKAHCSRHGHSRVHPTVRAVAQVFTSEWPVATPSEWSQHLPELTQPWESKSFTSVTVPHDRLQRVRIGDER